MTRNEQIKIKKNDKLWRDIGVLYNAYLKPVKKQMKLQYKPCYPFLFRGRNAD